MTEGVRDEDTKPRKVQGTSVIEWLAAGLGGMLFATMIGYMVVVGLNRTDGPPVVEIFATSTTRLGGAFIVKFEARNTGAQTLSGLTVHAALSEGDKEVETSDVTIDYLPTGSKRSGGFFFKHDPNAYVLEMTPKSYMDP